MKRMTLYTTGVIAWIMLLSSPLMAQVNTSETVASLKKCIQSDPARAADEVDQLLKGKNKKKPELLVAVGQAYLESGKEKEAQIYAELARKADMRYASAYVLEGDIALVQKNIGTACQFYEQAIYFDAGCKEAYLKYAYVYRSSAPQLAIEKVMELKKIDPSYLPADRAIAEMYYDNNQFSKATLVYAQFINSSGVTEDDLIKYAFALFLSHDFNTSLQVAQKGLERYPRHATFNRLMMYNYADLKRYEEGLNAADQFFNASDHPDFAYLDYVYYGHLLHATKQHDAAIAQYTQAMELDNQKANLWREISEIYESKGDYDQAIESFRKYMETVSPEKHTADLDLELGKLYYAKGTDTDTPSGMENEKIEALKKADEMFAAVSRKASNSHLGNFWRARTQSALDPETTQGLAKPYYELVIAMLIGKNEPMYNTVLVECYSYLGYYHLVTDSPDESKIYWNKILEIAPGHTTALKALEGLKS